MRNPHLEWMDENQQVQRLEIMDRIFIGRTCQGVEVEKRILLHSALVSRDHAVISMTAAHLRITDTSKNGTWINGVRMAAGSTKDLADGDIIRIGEFSFRVLHLEDSSADRDDVPRTDLTIVTPSETMVTTLVADVRGFSDFSQKHASADVFGLMKEIFTTFSAIVNQFKGTIKDYAGDAVYAFWDHRVGQPEEQALLACQAAMQQMKDLDLVLAKVSGKHAGLENIRMGWGITTGAVTMSHYGSRVADLAMVGDCINLAFRLSEIANKELPEIVICSQTAKLVLNELRVKDLGEFPIRGRKGTEQLFTIG